MLLTMEVVLVDRFTIFFTIEIRLKTFRKNIYLPGQNYSRIVHDSYTVSLLKNTKINVIMIDICL